MIISILCILLLLFDLLFALTFLSFTLSALSAIGLYLILLPYLSPFLAFGASATLFVLLLITKRPIGAALCFIIALPLALIPGNYLISGASTLILLGLLFLLPGNTLKYIIIGAISLYLSSYLSLIYYLSPLTKGIVFVVFIVLGILMNRKIMIVRQGKTFYTASHV